MHSFKDFFRRYNNKDVVAALEVMQQIVEFYHNKDFVMLKLGCTLPNMANKSVYNSTSAKF